MLNPPVQPPPPSKRKAEGIDGGPKRKRPKSTTEPGMSSSAPPSKVSVTLKLGPKPPEPERFPCCLCVSMSQDGLLRVQDPPIGRRELPESLTTLYDATRWMAHEECAKVVPETWVDTIESAEILPDGSHFRESRVFGVDAIVKDRWNLVGYRFSCISFVLTRYFRNVRLVPRDDKKHMVPLSSAPRESAPSHSTCPARGRVTTVFLIPYCAKSRRKSFWLMCSRHPLTYLTHLTGLLNPM